MLTLRELHGDAYVSWCRQQYDEGRHYLKNCGKPKDWYDIFLIKSNKATCDIFRRYVIEDRGF